MITSARNTNHCTHLLGETPLFQVQSLRVRFQLPKQPAVDVSTSAAAKAREVLVMRATLQNARWLRHPDRPLDGLYSATQPFLGREARLVAQRLAAFDAVA